MRLKDNRQEKILGCIDADFSSGENTVLLLLNDIRPTSLLDSYISNIKMPWNRSNSNNPDYMVSRLELCKVKDSNEFEFLSTLYYGLHTTCCKYNGFLQLAGIGFTDGAVHFYKYNKNDYPVFKVLFSEKIHEGRVRGISLNYQLGLGYTIGDDGCLMVVDLAKNWLTEGFLIRYSSCKQLSH